MPWKECSVMDERLRFIARLLDGESMSDLCREAGISRKTGYKIFSRYKEEGVTAITDRQRRPYHYANQLAPQLEAMIVGLYRGLRLRVTPAGPATWVLACWDGAGWHAKGRTLKVPDNVVLLPLPPYSPELNSMENVWEYLRANKLSAGVWDRYEEIVQACAEAWNWLMNDPDRIRSIGTREWATVNV